MLVIGSPLFLKPSMVVVVVAIGLRWWSSSLLLVIVHFLLRNFLAKVLGIAIRRLWWWWWSSKAVVSRSPRVVLIVVMRCWMSVRGCRIPVDRPLSWCCHIIVPIGIIVTVTITATIIGKLPVAIKVILWWWWSRFKYFVDIIPVVAPSTFGGMLDMGCRGGLGCEVVADKVGLHPRRGCCCSFRLS